MRAPENQTFARCVVVRETSRSMVEKVGPFSLESASAEHRMLTPTNTATETANSAIAKCRKFMETRDLTHPSDSEHLYSSKTRRVMPSTNPVMLNGTVTTEQCLLEEHRAEVRPEGQYNGHE